jgi:hypothetical protein
MKQFKTYTLPIFQIESLTPTLEKDGAIYAYLITVKDKSGAQFEFRERRGLPMRDYIGKPVECILEITKADFIDKNTDAKKLPKNIFKGKYAWSHSGYKFIPELVEMIEGHQDEEDYEYDEDEYDVLAEKLFKEWGVAGMGLDVYQDKPMVETEEGVFLFNEYQNEEEIEEWQLNDPVYFRPKEILLRGIKPYEGEWKVKKTLEEEYDVKPYEKLIIGRWRIID